LQTEKVTGLVDDEVATRVLTEWDVKSHSAEAKRRHDRQRRAIADVLRMIHVVKIAYESDGTMTRPPE